MDDSNKKLGVLDKLKKIIDIIKKIFWIWFVFSITLSLILLIAFSLKYRENIQLQDINSWISVILGLVALVATVISILLSFYSYDKQNELNEKSAEINTRMESILEKILSLSEETSNNIKYSLNNNSNLNNTKAIDINNEAIESEIEKMFAEKS